MRLLFFQLPPTGKQGIPLIVNLKPRFTIGFEKATCFAHVCIPYFVVISRNTRCLDLAAAASIGCLVSA